MLLGYFVVSKGRDALMSLLVAFTYDRYASDPKQAFYTALQVKAADVWSIVLMGIVLVILIVVLEHVYRTAAQVNQVWSCFSQVLMVGFAAMFVFELVITLAASVVQPLSVGNFIISAIYLVAAGLFWWLWRTLRAPKTAT